MSKAENNEELDADILQSKADVLRARDIIPASPSPPKKKTGQEPKSQIISEEAALAADTTKPSIPNKLQEKTEIPRFDLAEEVMAEQRRFTSIKRKAPGKKAEAQIQEPKAESVSYAIKQPSIGLTEQEQIIAEIVARDIEKLRRGGTLGLH